MEPGPVRVLEVTYSFDYESPPYKIDVALLPGLR